MFSGSKEIRERGIYHHAKNVSSIIFLLLKYSPDFTVFSSIRKSKLERALTLQKRIWEAKLLLFSPSPWNDIKYTPTNKHRKANCYELLRTFYVYWDFFLFQSMAHNVLYNTTKIVVSSPFKSLNNHEIRGIKNLFYFIKLFNEQ